MNETSDKQQDNSNNDNNIYIPIREGNATYGDAVKINCTNLPSCDKLLNILKSEVAPLEYQIELSIMYQNKNAKKDVYKIASLISDASKIEEYADKTQQRLLLTQIKAACILDEIRNQEQSFSSTSMNVNDEDNKLDDKKLKRDKKLGELISIYNHCDKLCKKDPMTFVGKAYVYYMRERFDIAISTLDAALILNSNCIPALLLKAQIFYEQCDYIKSLFAYKSVLKRCSSLNCPAEVRVAIGFCYLKLDRLDLARLAFEYTLQSDICNEEVDNKRFDCGLKIKSLLGLASVYFNKCRNMKEQLLRDYENTKELDTNLIGFYSRALDYIAQASSLESKYNESNRLSSNNIITDVKAIIQTYVSEHYLYLNQHEECRKTAELILNSSISGSTNGARIKCFATYLLAKSYHIESRFEEALIQYQNAIKLLELKPHFHKEEKDSRESMKKWRRRVQNDNNILVSLYYGIAQVLVHPKFAEYSKAKKYLNKALKHLKFIFGDESFGSVYLLKLLGFVCFKLNEYQNACSQFEQALQFENIDSDDTHIRLLTYLARSYEKYDYTKAKNAYERCLQKLKSNKQSIDLQIYNNYSVMLIQTNQMFKAQTLLNSLLSKMCKIGKQGNEECENENENEHECRGDQGVLMDGSSIEGDLSNSFVYYLTIKYNYAIALEETGDYRSSIELHRDILRRDPNYIDSSLRIAMISEKCAHYQDAITNYKKIIERFPNDIKAYSSLAHLYMKLNYVDEALTLFEKVFEMDPKDTFNLLSLAYFYYDAVLRSKIKKSSDKKKYIDLSKKYLSRVLRKQDPFNLVAANALAVLFAEKSQLNTAKSIFLLVRDIRPCMSEVWLNLGHILFEQRNYVNAVTLYSKALELSKSETNSNQYQLSIQLYLAQSYYANSRLDECIQLLQCALIKWPENTLLQYNLAISKQAGALSILAKSLEQTSYSLFDIEKADFELHQALNIFTWLNALGDKESTLNKDKLKYNPLCASFKHQHEFFDIRKRSQHHKDLVLKEIKRSKHCLLKAKQVDLRRKEEEEKKLRVMEEFKRKKQEEKDLEQRQNEINALRKLEIAKTSREKLESMKREQEMKEEERKRFRKKPRKSEQVSNPYDKRDALQQENDEEDMFADYVQAESGDDQDFVPQPDRPDDHIIYEQDHIEDNLSAKEKSQSQANSEENIKDHHKHKKVKAVKDGDSNTETFKKFENEEMLKNGLSKSITSIIDADVEEIKDLTLKKVRRILVERFKFSKKDVRNLRDFIKLTVKSEINRLHPV